jgi:hypothetical protein
MANNGGYEKALLTYIDVLGFRELIHQSKNNVPVILDIKKLLESLAEKFSQNDRFPHTEFCSFTFSDLVVRCTLIKNSVNIGKLLNQELSSLKEKQLSLALQGEFVRGSICIGDIFTDNGLLFGPALVKAYELESIYAIFPRIIVDRNLIWETKKQDSIAVSEEFVKRGEEGAYYLDYLFAVINQRYRNFGSDRANELLLQHQQVLENIIKSDISKMNERTKQKYIWLAQYHNSVVDRLVEVSDPSQPIKAYKIPDSFLKF